MIDNNCSKILRKYLGNSEESTLPKLSADAQFDDKNITFFDLQQYLLTYNETGAVDLLDKLYVSIRESLTDLDLEIAEDATIDILLMLINETSLLQKHHRDIKQKFGNITFNVVERFYTIIKKFKEVASNDTLDYICKMGYTIPNRCIRFKIPFMYISACDVVSKLKNFRPVDQNLVNSVQSFSMLYDSNEEYFKTQSSLCNTSENDGNWLVNFLKEYNTSSFSNEIFCEYIVAILTNPTVNMKQELFNLLNFENTEFLNFLQSNKSKILKHTGMPEMDDIVIPAETARHPVAYSQVTVQSQQERDLSKQLRKIEKKKQKGGEFENYAEYSQTKTDYQKASVAPILKKKRPVTESYPNVYDSAKENWYSKVSAHGTGSTTVPQDSRVDFGAYEQITVKPADKNTAPKLSKFVRIEELDDLGKIIFRNVDALNTIQTMVFPTAYTTNENMLICAPTGAGKTNIALLTVANQIRQFTENGVVDRSKFKIVYVVPMKALAAEITANFSKKLAPLGIVVRELTGDMQLTKTEIKETQLVVTTPEKWDVITRKGAGDNEITAFIKLLIIDEVHLLHGTRGPVIEALVARTLRQVETSQSMIRIVGLSATLPNYVDVARFLNVNLNVGLFYFDGRFRPVPLTQVFVGIKPMRLMQQMAEMDNACFTKIVTFASAGQQSMIFVHARNQTVQVATVMKEKALAKNQIHLFQPPEGIDFFNAKRQFAKSSNKMLSELIQYGFGVHHAGMARTDRTLVEKYFREGVIRVLVCTATLAWGVNLPAHGVIIRGTEIYDSKRGSFVNLDILDVLQIFGRAGRPQYDTTGIGVIITSQDSLPYYLRLLTHQVPIESSFLDRLPDHLNAEIVLGTVSNINEAVEWLRYTYLHQRLTINPQVYGINFNDVQNDPMLDEHRRRFITIAARSLDRAHMIRFNEANGDFSTTDLGRTASHYYINYDTVQLFNNCIEPFMTEKEIFGMIAQAEEFQQLKVRNEECEELELLVHEYCELAVPGGITSVTNKVNILMQTFLSHGYIKCFSLSSDMAYVTQNVVRIARALFDIALHQNNPVLSGRCLMIAQMFELQQWDFQSPMRQFNSVLGFDIIEKIEQKNMSVESLREIDVTALGSMLRNQRYAQNVQKCAYEFPMLDVESTIHPITRAVLRIKLSINPNFQWNDRVHGRSSESFWLWIEDPENNTIYYSENFSISKYNVVHEQPVELAFTVPLVEPTPSQYLARITSNKWLRCTTLHALSFRDLVLPESYPPHTDLLELQPLPVGALKNKKFEALYTFSHFNPIQTQLFHCLYHTDYNTLVGAPTGSGKTIISELAVLRLFNRYPDQKVVYIAPLKALVRERVRDWKDRFEKRLGKKVTELTGDVNPSIKDIERANIIITTPEKWDGLSRSWQSRSYVKKVGLMIIDEIHLLGEDRGPVLEVIVSRTNYIAANTNFKLRIVGLSTAMANARDLANWLGIKQVGLFNFRPSVRPVPLEVHISGHPGKHYCPRMISMNRPTYQAIRLHAPDSPSLVFVSSRRQTRLTALDLIGFLAADRSNKQWLHMSEERMMEIVSTIRDPSLKLCLPFGVGIHHAGLDDHDRRMTEELFVNQKIQVLVATATLAWGVNFPAHLVVVKGTEYFDGKLGRYTDMPITDVLQMMGRAGRPQFDTTGVAVVLVHDIKKNFYKKFLYEPFPVESNLLQVLPDHVNAEIVAGTVTTKSELVEYLTWTYFFRRLIQNPVYYKLSNLEPESVSGYLNDLSQATLQRLEESYCIELDEETQIYKATPNGIIASYYYLSNETMRYFRENIKPSSEIEDLLMILSRAHEYTDFPVRHNEDIMNKDLAADCRLPTEEFTSPYTKVHILLQMYFSRMTMPIADYNTDLKSALEQTIRILQAMVDVAADFGWLSCTLRIQQLMQMIIEGCWLDDSPLKQLYKFEEGQVEQIEELWNKKYPQYCVDVLAGIQAAYQSNKDSFYEMIKSACGIQAAKAVTRAIGTIPVMDLNIWFEDQTDGKKLQLTRDKISNFNATVVAGREYSIAVNVNRIGKKSLSVETSQLPRSKDESWFLNLGFKSSDTLLALKRASVHSQAKYKLIFCAPDKPGNYTVTLYFMSDSYIGLDQQFDIYMNVIN